MARLTQNCHNTNEVRNLKSRRHTEAASLHMFEVLTEMVIKSSITPCSPLKITRRFGGTCRLYVLD
jgi:hypothetical protein